MSSHSALESMTWTTSSFSDGGANCVVVGRDTTDRVGLRDSKVPDLPAIIISAEAWSRFIDALKATPADHRPTTFSPTKAELYDLDLSGVTWATLSAGPTVERIEIADLPSEAIAVRTPASQTTLRYTRGEWDAFVRGVKAGQFDVRVAA